MRVETWQKILGKIDQAILDKKEADLNFKFENINIIEELKDELKQVLSKDEYKKWEDEGFNLNHLFQVKGRTGTGEYTVLDLFAGWGLENGVKALLAINGINVNAQNQRGLASLHHAARNGHIQVVKALLAVDGIDVNIKNKMNGSTPLHYAAAMGHVEVVETLLAVKGIDVNIKDERNGSTPLHYTAAMGHVEVVEALLAINGINVNAQNQRGLASLHHAARNGHIQVVKALLAVDGIDVNIKNKMNGSTPLHYAIRSGRIDIVNALLAKGAKVNIKDKMHGGTPLHYAIGSGRIDIVDALLAKGAKVNIKDNYGNTQLGLAQKLIDGTIGIHLSSDEKQQWLDVVTAMQQRLEFTRKRNFAAGGAILGTGAFEMGLAVLLITKGDLPVEPISMILTAVAIAVVSLAVGYIVYQAFKEPSTKVNETQPPVIGAREI